MKPDFFVEGVDVVIRRDLDKHRSLLETSKLSLDSFKTSVAHEIQKKKRYLSLINEGQYDEASMRASIVDININIRHLSDKVKLAKEEIAHHTLIVDTLTEQLADYEKNFRDFYAVST